MDFCINDDDLDESYHFSWNQVKGKKHTLDEEIKKYFKEYSNSNLIIINDCFLQPFDFTMALDSFKNS